jgi:primosomal protein N' (replication factor Y) (superfamily II helicase)
MTEIILRVALKAPLHELYDYLPPASDIAPAVGQRVRVPFGRGERIGVIAQLSSTTSIARDKLKSASEILDSSPLLDAPLVELLNWAAAYYQHPPGEVFAAALPTALRKGEQPRGATEPRWHITPTGAKQLQSTPLNAPVQQLLLGSLNTHTHGLNAAELSDIHDGWQRAVRELCKKSLVEKRTVVIARPPQPTKRTSSAPQLNDDQQHAVDLIAPPNADTWLLEGVTGSGKTEVYLRLIEAQLQAGRQALVVVPEIGLTPQLLARFTERLDTNIVVMHSNLNDSERLHAWVAAANGTAGVILGTRSAIFTPLHSPGIIVIDEEHDPSLKQQEGFRYSARDIAIVRGKKLGVPTLLGSATPSFETLVNAANGRYRHLRLPSRAGGASQPSVHLIDARKYRVTDGLSQPMVETIRRHLDASGQVLLYLNRRGFAPTLFCAGCGSCIECKRCDARLVVHQQRNLAVCHHCGFEARVPESCPACGGELQPLGQGTERVELALQQHFPAETIVRLDRDATRRKGSMEESLDAIRSGKARLMLGTQMLTKGHDFPNVTLVCILDADQGLFGTDFRSGERLAQNFIQVAGRAGRADRSGEVWIQSLYPEHPQLKTLISTGYPGFAKEGIAERKVTAWPPFSHLALLRAECNNKATLYEFLDHAKRLAEHVNPGQIRILGPASAPMERRSGRWRAQILLQSEHRPTLQAALTAWRQALAGSPASRKARWSIDVDPIELF